MDPVIRSKAPRVPEIANPPITVNVVLMCEPCRAFTPHVYVITRRAGMLAFEQIYGCTACKAERRFGLLC